MNPNPVTALNPYFEDLENLKSYLNFLARCEAREDGEVHHILPKCLFPEYKNLSTHPWNGITLSPRDHLWAHYWLATCDHHGPRQAFFLMTNRVREGLTVEEFEEISRAREKVAHEKKGWSRVHLPETGEIRFIPPEDLRSRLDSGWVLGLPEGLISHGRVCVINSNTGEMRKVFPGETLAGLLSSGWSLGRSYGMRGWVWIQKDYKLSRVSPDSIESKLKEGWSLECDLSSLAKNQGCVRVYSSEKSRFVSPELVQNYLDIGWSSAPLEDKVWIIKGCETKQIPVSKQESFLSEGWCLGRGEMPMERRERISKTLMGRPGTPHTESSKEKLREANLGRKMTEEDKDKMSQRGKERAGSKYIYNPVTLERRRVKGEVMTDLLSQGWVIGKGPR